MAASPGPPGAKRARRAGGGGGGGALGGGEAPGGGSGGGGARGEGRARWPGAFGRMQAWLEAEAAAGAGLLAGHLDVRGPGAGGAPGGHTVFAADARAAGEPLVRVPQSCVLHWGRVVEGGFGRRLEAVRQNVVRAQPEAGRAALQVHEQTVLLLFMAAGRRDPACPWHAYFETMPGEPQHLLAWPADLLDAEFAGTHLAHATEKERAELRAQYEALREGIEKGGGVPELGGPFVGTRQLPIAKVPPRDGHGRPRGLRGALPHPGAGHVQPSDGGEGHARGRRGARADRLRRSGRRGHRDIHQLRPQVERGAAVRLRLLPAGQPPGPGHNPACLRRSRRGGGLPAAAFASLRGALEGGRRGPARGDRWKPGEGGGGGGAPGGEGWLSVGPFFIRSQEMGGVPGELLSALAVCMVEAPGEELQLTLDEVEGLKKKLESKLDALKPRSAADSKLVGRCGGGGAREGGSEDRAGAVAVQRRRAAAIYRDGQRRVLQEAIQELEGLLDEEDGTGP